MADNVSQEIASEPAELSIDEIAARRAAAPQEEAPATDEQTEDAQEAQTDEAAEPDEEEAATEEKDDASEEDAEPEIKDDVLIKLDDGSTITVSELKAKATTLETENARISQEVADERRELQQTGQKMSETLDSVVNYLATKLPPEPEQSLLWSDPARHHQMTYIRESAIRELQSLLQVKDSVSETANQLSDVDFKKYEAAETAKLIAAVPLYKDPARLKAALETAKSYAKSIGFSDDEFDKTKDSRIQRMVIDAAYGAKAREAAQQAKVQVKSAVAKSPTQPRSVHPNSMKAISQQNAVRRAQSTGSIDDVLAARMARVK